MTQYKVRLGVTKGLRSPEPGYGTFTAVIAASMVKWVYGGGPIETTIELEKLPDLSAPLDVGLDFQPRVCATGEDEDGPVIECHADVEQWNEFVVSNIEKLFATSWRRFKPVPQKFSIARNPLFDF